MNFFSFAILQHSLLHNTIFSMLNRPRKPPFSMLVSRKMITTIIHRRLELTIVSSIDGYQFSFRKERGSTKELLSLGLIQNGRLRVGKPTFIAFDDLQKAFDTVSWPKLFDILKNKGIKYKERRISSSLCRDQKAVVEMQGKRGKARIRKRVRKGCPL